MVGAQPVGAFPVGAYLPGGKAAPPVPPVPPVLPVPPPGIQSLPVPLPPGVIVDDDTLQAVVSFWRGATITTPAVMVDDDTLQAMIAFWRGA